MHKSLSVLGMLVAASTLSAAPVGIPNGDFTLGTGQYGAPTDWSEDQARVAPGLAHSGWLNAASDGLLPRGGAGGMLRVTVDGDADPATSFVGTVSNSSGLGTYQADTLYMLTWYAARNSYVGTNEWFVVGGLRADGTIVADVDVDIRAVAPAADEDLWYPVSVTLNTQLNPEVVGKQIKAFLGMRHNNNYNKALFFDDLTLDATAVPEPATFGLLAVGGLLALRRRR